MTDLDLIPDTNVWRPDRATTHNPSYRSIARGLKARAARLTEMADLFEQYIPADDPRLMEWRDLAMQMPICADDILAYAKEGKRSKIAHLACWDMCDLGDDLLEQAELCPR